MTDMQSREAQEIDELLPWYERGTLDPAEMRRVEDYLRAHPEMQFRLGLIREELAETVAANESLGMPGGASRERLFAAIAAEASTAPRLRSRLNVWWRTWLPDGMSPRLGLAAAAACLVIALQAAALIAFTFAQPDGGYKVASGTEPGQAHRASYFLVRFTDNARAADIAALLKTFDAVIVDGPKPGGVFKIRVASRTPGNDEAETTITKLREKSDIIAFVMSAGQ